MTTPNTLTVPVEDDADETITATNILESEIGWTFDCPDGPRSLCVRDELDFQEDTSGVNYDLFLGDNRTERLAPKPSTTIIDTGDMAYTFNHGRSRIYRECQGDTPMERVLGCALKFIASHF